MILSSIAALIGIGLLLGGLALIAVHGFARDDDGFYTSDTEPLRSAAYAITTDEISLDADVADDVPEDLLGTLRIRAEAATARPIFVGIGRSVDVERYLAGVAHSQLTDFRRGAAVFDEVPGRAPAGRPGAEPFWVAQSEGDGQARGRVGTRGRGVGGRGAERGRPPRDRGRGRHRRQGRLADLGGDRAHGRRAAGHRDRDRARDHPRPARLA